MPGWYVISEAIYGRDCLEEDDNGICIKFTEWGKQDEVLIDWVYIQSPFEICANIDLSNMYGYAFSCFNIISGPYSTEQEVINAFNVYIGS